MNDDQRYIVSDAHLTEPFTCRKCKEFKQPQRVGYLDDAPREPVCAECIVKLIDSGIRELFKTEQYGLCIILPINPNTFKSIRIKCACGEKFVTKIPAELISVETGHMCPGCSKIFAFQDFKVRTAKGVNADMIIDGNAVPFVQQGSTEVN